MATGAIAVHITGYWDTWKNVYKFLYTNQTYEKDIEILSFKLPDPESFCREPGKRRKVNPDATSSMQIKEPSPLTLIREMIPEYAELPIENPRDKMLLKSLYRMSVLFGSLNYCIYELQRNTIHENERQKLVDISYCIQKNLLMKLTSMLHSCIPAEFITAFRDTSLEMCIQDSSIERWKTCEAFKVVQRMTGVPTLENWQPHRQDSTTGRTGTPFSVDSDTTNDKYVVTGLVSEWVDGFMTSCGGNIAGMLPNIKQSSSPLPSTSTCSNMNGDYPESEPLALTQTSSNSKLKIRLDTELAEHVKVEPLKKSKESTTENATTVTPVTSDTPSTSGRRRSATTTSEESSDVSSGDSDGVTVYRLLNKKKAPKHPVIDLSSDDDSQKREVVDNSLVSIVIDDDDAAAIVEKDDAEPAVVVPVKSESTVTSVKAVKTEIKPEPSVKVEVKAEQTAAKAVKVKTESAAGTSRRPAADHEEVNIDPLHLKLEKLRAKVKKIEEEIEKRERDQIYYIDASSGQGNK